MTNLKKTTASAALIALMSAAPLAVYAAETGSPQQAVDADPDEYVAEAPVSSEGSLEGTAKAVTDTDEADVVENVDGSLIEEDAKSDG